MKHPLRAALGLLCCSTVCAAADFAEPVMLKAAGKPIRVEAPGYAFPCLADLNGSGTKSLLVGQFAGGKIMVYKQEGNLKFSAGEWLKAEGKPAEVPGVW